MASTTKIDVYLKGPTGVPLTNTRFIIKPTRAGFWSANVGVVEDQELIFSTDLHGYVQIDLWPLPYPYVMTYSYDDESVPGHFLFYVPDVDGVVNFQDLIVTRADSNDKYADEILRQIIEAKVATIAAANEAQESAEASEASKESAKNFAIQTSEDATSTKNDRDQVALTQQQFNEMYMSLQQAIQIVQGIAIRNELSLGNYTLWVDSAGRLRILNGKPVNKDTEGTVVGTQS